MKPEYVCVLGDSHVRAFARHAVFLPLFIGSGKETCFVTASHAAATRQRLLANLDRIEPRPVLLVLGEPDVRLHLENLHGTRGSGAASDLPQMEGAVARYAGLLREARARHGAPVAVLTSAPTPRAEHNRLARVFNEKLAAECAAQGVPCLDLWSEIVQPDGVVDPRYSADHVHLNERIVALLAPRMQRLGWLPPGFQAEPDFEWSYLYRFPVGAAETRVWGDANTGGDVHRRKFARTELVAAAVDRIAASLARKKIASILVADACEGFVAFRLPARSGCRIAAWERDPRKVAAGERLRAFARRDDIDFHCGDWREAGPADVVIALDESAASAAARLARVHSAFLLPEPSRDGAALVSTRV